jgi:hypothetical protein
MSQIQKPVCFLLQLNSNAGHVVVHVVDAGFSPWRLMFMPKSDHMWPVMDKVAMEHFFFRVLWFSYQYPICFIFSQVSSGEYMI